MGLVDGLIKQVMKNPRIRNQVMGGAMGLIGSAGGLSGLLGKLNAAGLTEKAQSWVGTGENEPMSADEVRQTIGSQELARIAGEAGVSEDEAAAELAEVLPGMVDQLTPGGQIDEATVEQELGAARAELG